LIKGPADGAAIGDLNEPLQLCFAKLALQIEEALEAVDAAPRGTRTRSCGVLCRDVS
jgi:hypothetical protein